MTEQNKDRTNILIWVAFLAAASTILLLTSSTINYSSINVPVTSLDQIGGILPYPLFVGVVLYYFVKAKLKGALSGGTRSWLRALGIMLLIVGGALLVAILAILFLIPQQPSPPSTTPVSPVPSTASGYNALNWPIFSLSSALTLFMIAFPIVALLLLTYLRRKTDIIGEPVEEGIVSEEVWASAPETIYDDYRRAIIANYIDGKEFMIHRGVSSSDFTTPREFESSVIESIIQAKADFVPLTRLFEEARFSVHSMKEPERARSEKHRKRLETLSS